MSGFSGFASGWQQRGDSNRRSRREIAQAFSEFRRANPTATLADMQTYIDGVAGNSNYLRGGLPSNEMLTTIASENERRAQEERMRQRLEDTARRGQIMGQYTALADDFIVNNDFQTGSEGLTAFRDSLGLTDQDITSIGLGGMFSDQRINTLRQRRALEMLPQIQSIIEDTDASIDLGTLQEQFPDAPRPILQNLLSSARQEQQRISEERERQRRAEEEARGLQAWDIRQRFRSTITSDPQVQALARRGDRAATVRYIAGVAREMPEGTFELVFGVPRSQASEALFADYFDQIIEIQRLTSEAELDSYNENQRRNAQGSLAQAREASGEVVDQIARDTDNGTIAMAMRQMEENYIFDQTLGNTVAFLLRSAPDEIKAGNANAMIDWVQNQEEFARLASQPQYQPSYYTGGQPITLTMQPFETFLRNEAQDISAQGEEFIQAIETAQSIEDLRALQQAAQDWAALQQRTLQAYDQNPTAWVEPGTGGGYDRRRVMGSDPGSLISRTDQQYRMVLQRIQAKQQQLAARAEQEAESAAQNRAASDAEFAASRPAPLQRDAVRDTERRIRSALSQRAGLALTTGAVGLARVLPGGVGRLGEDMAAASSNYNEDVKQADGMQAVLLRHFASMPDPAARERALAQFERDPSAYIEANLSARDD